uniref:Protonectarina mastoparan n=1 Tax=Protonectarina sylveirae TaxID=91438 RepID=MASTP_PROSY|nr:RecName: Full=Protonectarina mastoparan; Short=Protonectarina-MP [Protonectarina sylveirae]prf//1918355B wasp venom peptide [Protonectarina sylveirae]
INWKALLDAAKKVL